jgi:hypothetical protein
VLPKLGNIIVRKIKLAVLRHYLKLRVKKAPHPEDVRWPD